MAREEELGRMTPIRMVSREISASGSMNEEDVHSSLERLMWRLSEEAAAAIEDNPLSPYALNRAMEYQVLAEMVVTFGSTLAALSDMEEYELSAGRDKARIS